MKTDKILVTGGAGFIGSCIAYELNRRGYTNITIVDRLGKTEKWRNLVGLQYNEYMEVDAFRARRQETYCDFDVVFALGACSSTREMDASYLASNNLADMIDLYQWCQTGAGIHFSTLGEVDNMPRFIYASSAATYGLSTNQSDSLPPISCRPINPYGFCKNAFDQWTANQGLLDRVVGLKYFNIVGPNSRHKGIMTDFVAKTYDQIVHDGYVTLYDTHLHGKPDARDFLYVKDAVDMTLFFAFDENGGRAHGLFNIGSGQSHSWKDVAALAWKAAGRSGAPDIRYANMPDALRARYQYYTCADISKLRAAGYEVPITPIADAVSEYVQTYLVTDKRRGEAS